MTPDDLRARLATLGLTLDDRAFAAALAGARHLKAELTRLAEWLAKPQ